MNAICDHIRQSYPSLLPFSAIFMRIVISSLYRSRTRCAFEDNRVCYSTKTGNDIVTDNHTPLKPEKVPKANRTSVVVGNSCKTADISSNSFKR